MASTVTIGTPFSETATRVMLCGGGELGKEVAIELKRLGCEVIVLDRYENAPAMQVADRSYCISMLDEQALKEIALKEKPAFIVPEIEAIATGALVDLEQQGFNVVPSARAAQLTMNREGIRRLAAEELALPTSKYAFADEWDSFVAAARTIGFPNIVKPIMSSSGKGQSLLKSEEDLVRGWAYAQEGGRAGTGKVIVESLVEFDYEITLLTIRHVGGTSFCEPIGHRQEDGDYRESWQPQAMSERALARAKDIAAKVTEALGGYGLFGVELFISGDEVYFSEVSPRPHDTGMVTLISQHLSEFALHARAFLGLPIPDITFHGPSASTALLVQGESGKVEFSGLSEALAHAGTDLKLFGKPEVKGRRRMGVALARAGTVEDAVESSKQVARAVKVLL
ncbi:MAG: formate-dependent phosphoribosylglycinamide formyltransferase [Wenzhouxiangellaceae bacterium]|nr:formate-dependent phosphoribosylglycinamide formyltransferase [Wenzhouxiangellaceae bacterium]MBS3746725.1 formate-dependent phosphoribosylglycinamide formyltransferase [Wenzhouxiangellaceae bacterium]MBS3823651.1 formate-dependent phosphoribosylglycinamide formyltransferase [Wenzhouxiangellaceae bacterium]